MVVHSPIPFARISTLNPVKPSVAVGAIQRNLTPSAVFNATNLEGASTVATAAPESLGDADSVGVAESLGVADSVGVAEIEGVGAASSVLLADLDQTIMPSKTIPITTAKTTRFEVPCFGCAAGFGAAATTGFTGAGATGATTFRTELVGTGGTENLVTDALLALFFTARFAGAFLATFFAALFLATAFFAAVFFTARFAGAFLATFFAALFLAGAFLATFFAALFFLTAT